MNATLLELKYHSPVGDSTAYIIVGSGFMAAYSTEKLQRQQLEQRMATARGFDTAKLKSWRPMADCGNMVFPVLLAALPA